MGAVVLLRPIFSRQTCSPAVSTRHERTTGTTVRCERLKRHKFGMVPVTLRVSWQHFLREQGFTPERDQPLWGEILGMMDQSLVTVTSQREARWRDFSKP